MKTHVPVPKAASTLLPEDFLLNHWHKRPFLLPDIGGLTPMTPEDVFHLYAEHAPHESAFCCFSSTTALRDRKDLAAFWTQRDPRADDFARLNRQKVFIIRTVDLFVPWIGELARSWSHFFSTEVHANLYLSAKGTKGFPVHVDNHHVFAAQLHGAKQWRFWPPTYDAPMPGFTRELPPLEGDPTTVVSHELDTMYIPMGWRHDAQTLSNHSIHITIGVNPPRWLEFFRNALSSLAAEVGLLRRSLPMSFDGSRVSWDIDPADLELLKRFVCESLDNYLPERQKSQTL